MAPFAAGAVTGLGLGGLLILSSAAYNHYPGYWGNHGVYSYQYNTTLNGTQYDVTCYCMQYNPCTCEKVETQEYFTNLPQSVSRTSVRDNVTYVYVNGTAENSTSTTKSGAISTTHRNLGSVSLLAVSLVTISLFI